MDIVKSVQNYVNKMVGETAGLKVMLLDGETTSFVSVVLPQSHLLSKEVFLINRIDNKNREKMKHLKCICFIRPSAESVQALVDELRNPLYAEYHLFFSNIIKKSQIERLAEVDDFEVVKEVQEFYGDFLAIDTHLFHFNICYPHRPIYGESLSTWDGIAFQRCVDGLLAVLLALKKRPLIRYAKNSPLAKRLASEIQYQIQQESQLFDFRRPDTHPILLLLDRKNDPVTPLLNQWTYQAMVHELLGINNGRVDLGSAGDIKPELREIVLSSDMDPFYKKNMFLNLGDLGANIKTYVDEYQQKTKSNMKIESIAEMKRFVEEYPEFKKLSGNVSKHVALVGELSKIVEKCALLQVGELEQNLACVEQHAADLKSLQDAISNPKISAKHKINLVILYALRYEKSPSNSVNSLVNLLKTSGVDPRDIEWIKYMNYFAGADQRQEDIFSNESILSKGKSLVRGLQGVENVYTQHDPFISQILEGLSKNKLKDSLYPFVDTTTRDRPQDVVIFIIGGVTYAESKAVSLFNANNMGIRVVLGGTTIHNSNSFLQEVADACRRRKI